MRIAGNGPLAANRWWTVGCGVFGGGRWPSGRMGHLGKTQELLAEMNRFWTAAV